MSDTPTGAICPGQRTLMDNGGTHYLRVVFTAYWSDSMPSSEVFYITDHPLRLNPQSIAKLETDVMGLMRTFVGHTRVLRLTYVGYSGIEMSSDDVKAAGWHVISGAISCE